ncbi:hypothetical protein [Sphingomonas sp. Leaf4]|uniref:hypothetical protein n=1 Tax=Sphingomonas sp. Leaf4 TaxID=2876553 RepID=UPI001E3AEE05|nr:hypothetical protein [Sphingomonas sp. Leaf4]
MLDSAWGADDHPYMIVSALLLLAQAATPQPAQPADIIVVGQRAEQALADCLARACPPAEDVEASLQASVEQFTGGRYVDARRTLQASIRRNRDHAAQLPGPVSSLYATLATVAEHEGDADLWRTSARNNVLVLREHVGEGNPATLTEELSFADNILGMGQTATADEMYGTAQRHAIEAGHANIAAGAAFRRAWLAMLREQYDRAERFATQAVTLAGPGDRTIVELRDILRARIAIRKGDKGAVDALAARLRQSADAQPRLLFSRPIENIDPAQFIDLSFPIGGWNDSRIRFADVGYWVRPDGRTADAEVLQTSGLGQWRQVILDQVADRRYVPLDVPAGSPGTYRIDRFTIRGTIGIATGTRIRQRVGQLTVHIVDLTETEAMSAAAKRQMAEVRSRQGS